MIMNRMWSFTVPPPSRLLRNGLIDFAAEDNKLEGIEFLVLVHQFEVRPIDETRSIEDCRVILHAPIADSSRPPRRFQDFLASLPGVAPNTLSSRLKTMEDSGLVRRELYNERPTRLEYVLTDKDRSLGPIVKAMREWGTQHL